MKDGMTLQAFATEVQRQAESKKDFKVPTQKMEMIPLPDYRGAVSPEGYAMKYEMVLDSGSRGRFGYPARRLFHQQVSERTRIPWDYYERMQNKQPELFCNSVNTWLHDTDEIRMVRTLDGQARAYLGNVYRPLDNFDLFRAVAPHLVGEKRAGIRIVSANITETRFYIKAFSTRLRSEISVGDIVEAGVSIMNSEVGHGQLAVEPSVLRLTCLNGATINDSALKRRHVGGRSDSPDVEEYYSDQTRSAMDEAFWRQVCDVVDGCFSEVMFRKQVDKLKSATDRRIPKGGASLQEVVEVTKKQFSLSESEGDLILKNLIEGADLSQYGLMNAVTLAAQSGSVSYDRATELEHIGGEILELPQKSWNTMVAA
jgi:hypothetical protein